MRTLIKQVSLDSLQIEYINARYTLATGLVGPQGPVGPSAGDTVRVADVALSGGRAVRSTSDTGIAYADAYDVTRGPNLLGITRGAISAGAAGNVVTAGELNGFTGLTPGGRIWLAADGQISQIYDTTWKWMTVLGFALSATRIQIQLASAVRLST